MSRPYEMMYIVRPEFSEEQVNQTIQKYNDFLTERGAEEIEVKNLGKRKLAYPIRKYNDGIYVQVNYKADGSQVAPLERAMRLGGETIRHLTIALKNEPVMIANDAKVTEEESEEN